LGIQRVIIDVRMFLAFIGLLGSFFLIILGIFAEPLRDPRPLRVLHSLFPLYPPGNQLLAIDDYFRNTPISGSG